MLFAVFGLNSCGAVEVADRRKPELIFSPTHVNIATVRGYTWQRNLLPEAVNWWENQIDMDAISISDPVDADVVVYWEGIDNYCRYNTYPKIIRVSQAIPEDVAWQTLLHEIGHCVYGLPHHWSRSSIMYPEIPTKNDPLQSGWGSVARHWFYVLRGEREEVLRRYE